jgi:transcriptional regulator
MYQPPAFKEERLEVLHALIQAHPLGNLITAGAGGLLANLVPFTLVNEGERGTLRCHVARANDQVEALRTGAETLVIFQGPEAYITPSWYPSKQEHGRVVPTWDYVVVQVRGTPRLIEDYAWIKKQIGHLTSIHEGQRAHPWEVSDAPESYIAGQIKAIVGVEIPIATIEGKWKASQNRPEADRHGVEAGLRQDGTNEMAALVAEKGKTTSGQF